jgi:hypothetical protein
VFLPTKGLKGVNLTTDEVEELREILDRHEQYNDCHRNGGCCADRLIEFLEDLLG